MFGSRTVSKQPDSLCERALVTAESDFVYGNLAMAESSYSTAVHWIKDWSHDGPTDPVERRELLKQAQFGLAATQLARRDVLRAKDSAIAALSDSFGEQDEAPDSRRYILVCLAAAKTRQDFANAWSHMLEL